jgi:hypothetical protein
MIKATIKATASLSSTPSNGNHPCPDANECTIIKDHSPVKNEGIKLETCKGDLQIIIGYQKEIKGFKCKKYRGKGISSNKRSLYKGTHRNGFNDTISHEVSPNSYHYHTYS